jgi:hypothetical protein
MTDTASSEDSVDACSLLHVSGQGQESKSGCQVVIAIEAKDYRRPGDLWHICLGGIKELF